MILAGAEEEDVRGADAWFLHAPAGADHAGVPTMVIDVLGQIGNWLRAVES